MLRLLLLLLHVFLSSIHAFLYFGKCKCIMPAYTVTFCELPLNSLYCLHRARVFAARVARFALIDELATNSHYLMSICQVNFGMPTSFWGAKRVLQKSGDDIWSIWTLDVCFCLWATLEKNGPLFLQVYFNCQPALISINLHSILKKKTMYTGSTLKISMGWVKIKKLYIYAIL